jgi:hypothetical protein
MASRGGGIICWQNGQQRVKKLAWQATVEGSSWRNSNESWRRISIINQRMAASQHNGALAKKHLAQHQTAAQRVKNKGRSWR